MVDTSILATLCLLAEVPTAPFFHPLLVIALCALAGVGTVVLLPSRRGAPITWIGGALVLLAGLITAALLIRWAAASDKGGMGVYFWIFTLIALAGSVRVITHPKPVYSALYFVLTVFATAGLFLLVWAEFMAAALVLIYAGAILVTYVFVIMLASEASAVDGSPVVTEHDTVSREPLLACSVGFTILAILLFLIFDRAGQSLPTGRPYADAGSSVVSGSTQQLGAFLFKNHIINLELAGLILTIAMVGAILIARRRVVRSADAPEPQAEVLTGPATPVDDNPHSIPVHGTRNPRQKAYPQR
jgi:NADH-quinone oxidoreductase subunit J